VRGDVRAAERQPHRRRGSESDCNSSHTQLKRGDSVPCEILISFVVCTIFAARVVLVSGLRSNVRGTGRQPDRRRGSESDCTSSHTELQRRDSAPGEI
jgi:hypothetical protein